MCLKIFTNNFFKFSRIDHVCKYYCHAIFSLHMLLYMYRIMISYKDGGLCEIYLCINYFIHSISETCSCY